LTRHGSAAALLLAAAGVSLAIVLGGAAPAAAATNEAALSCQLGPNGQIKHVVIIQFDNVHLKRDNPNVPSDIEQIPALYNFMKDNGTLLANDHTVLISHTSDGILSTATGLYPSNFGGGVGNTFPYLNPNQLRTRGSATSGQVPGTSATSLFTYWTDLTNPNGDPLYTMINQPASSANPNGVNTPAPWVGFTRAGCDFAGVGAANMEFENDLGDLANVYHGTSSPQYQFGNWSYNTAYDQYNNAGSNLGETDYEGLAIHCSRQDSGSGGVCSSDNGGVPDVLPNEPGGYSGFNALYGALNIDPWLTGQPDQPVPASYNVCTPPPPATPPFPCTPPPAGNWLAPPIYDVFAPNATNTGPDAEPVSNLEAEGGSYPNYNSGPPASYVPGATTTSQILDSTGNAGFPGFDGTEANNALGYTAALQEAGVPVTYTYIADVHDDHYFTNNGNAFGPGEAGYEAQVREYNAAFTAFFQRLAADGINKGNTAFLFTVDEGDHYDGGPPLNPGCNGVTVPCEYDTSEAGGAAYGTSGFTRNEGEVDVNLPSLIQGQGNNTTFGFNADDAPAIVVPNQTNPAGIPPGQDSSTVRGLEHTFASTSEYNPIVGKTVPITVNMADQTEEQILHMVNSDPNRTPTFTDFGDPSFYLEGECNYVGGAQGQKPGPVTNEGPGCPAQDNGYAWNHGDIQPEIASTWQGWVGPGIKNLGETSAIWTDHTDARPTLMTLLGLSDDYAWDGLAVAPILQRSATPSAIRQDELGYDLLSAAYTQLEAPFGAFGMQTLAADTNAVESNTPGDSTYTGIDADLQTCASARASLTSQMTSALQGAESGKQAVGPLQALVLSAEAYRLIGDARTLATSSTPPPPTRCG
jgi:hypothetical protein